MKMRIYDMQAPVYNCLKQGNGVVLEESEEGILLFDRKAGIWILDQKNPETACQWIRKHYEPGMLVCAAYEAVIQKLLSVFPFKMRRSCFQVVWDKEAPWVDWTDLRLATEEDLGMICALYDLENEASLLDIIRSKRLVLATKDGRLAGFAGMHPEGSLGLLYVSEACRHQGVGTRLQLAAIAMAMAWGLVPYAHIFCDNVESLSLQKSLGMSFSSDLFGWLKN